MNKSKYIKSFNKLVSSLLSQLSPIIGSSYYSNFNRLIKFNSIYPINHFLENMYVHKQEIINKDEKYFYNYDLKSIDELNSDKSLLDEVLRLKNIYNQVDDESKNNLWTYLQAMLGIAEEYLLLSNNIKIPC